MTDNRAVAEMNQIDQVAAQLAELEGHFFETDDYRKFRTRVFRVLARREARLKRGLIEQWGAALIGPAGSGKSRIAERVIAEYTDLAEQTGGRKFGTKIVSAIVPGKATVRDTCKAILKALDEPPRVYRRVVCSMTMRPYRVSSGLHRTPPLLLRAGCIRWGQAGGGCYTNPPI